MPLARLFLPSHQMAEIELLLCFCDLLGTLSPGCVEGVGKGKYTRHGAGGGAGHGGRGGSGIYNGMQSEGGRKYGDADLPCELGSGTGEPSESNGNVLGGGMIGKNFSHDMFSTSLKKN